MYPESKCGHLTDLAKQFRTARVKAGLAKDLVLYCSRHDYGTRVLNNTGNLAAVMKTMGHRDVRTAIVCPEAFPIKASDHLDTTRETATNTMSVDKILY